MKKQVRPLLLAGLLAALVSVFLPFAVGAAGVVNDTFADGNSQNQNLAANSLQFFNSRAAATGTRTIRTDAVGSVEFDMTNLGTSSEAFWAHFTNAGSPVTLNVGDKISFSGTFSVNGFPGSAGSDIRFGLFDSKGTRNTTNLTGGQNTAAFGDDTGYGAQYFASGTGAPFILYRRDVSNPATTNIFNSMGAIANNLPTGWSSLSGAGASARQPLANATPYTFNYTVERLSATDTRVAISVTGAGLSNLTYAATESSASPYKTFDWFTFRIAGTNFATKMTFTRLAVEYFPSLPVITSQPQPSNLTVQVGSNVTTSVAASGNSLSYQWQKDGQPIQGNASASTPTLNLSNVQLSDAGVYRALVSNPGGGVASQSVTLNVSTDPVPPPPSIVTQPLDTKAVVNTPTALSVAATGDNLFYQWFKNGALIPGATQSTLAFPGAQVADSGGYAVVVSNSSGSVTSAAANLLVVSAMQANAFGAASGVTDVDIDAPLYITFNQAPKVGTTGRLRVYREDGALVDTIDMAAATQSRPNGTVTFNYCPVIVSGDTAAVYLHQKLAYGQSYYVTLEPGVVTDQSGAPFAGVTDPFVWNFSTKTSGPAAGSVALTVAADGTGDFATVQGAVDFVPASNNKRVVITVKKGTYTEIVYVGSNKPFVTVRGEDRNLSVIQYANNNNFNPTSTTHRAMFGVDAADFTLENITLRNTTPQGGSQAEAFRGNNNRIVLNRVNLYSYQDTLLLQGQSNQGGFVTDSYIEGDVDFMWGSGAVFFQNTEMKMLRSDAFYTQIRNGAGRNGYVYVNCKFTRAAGFTGSYLTRIDPDSFPYSQVVVINSQMDGVRPDPWRFDTPDLAVTAANYPNIRFWEYNSKDLNGNPLDVSQRHPISRQLTAAEAAQWSDPSFVLGGWAPQTKLTAAVSLSDLTRNYDGSPAFPTVTTEPAGLNVQLTYNGSATAPTAIGTYNVVATVQDATYQGTASGTLVINPVAATITLGNLFQTADGTPKPVSVNVTPAGAPVNVTYNGSAAPPSAPGTYSVVASIGDPAYKGGASATLTLYAPGAEPLRAFPGAEGSGALARGGRGGDVYHVTNLDDSGAGSLREGIRTASGPRTIVFDVSGTINLNSRLTINKSFLTIAGQTAPGDGVTVAGWPVVITNVNNVVIRYLRFRMGDLNCPAVQDDALWVDRASDVILDHVSASWSVDETLSVTDSDRVTVQWSFITESMKNSCHEKGAHGYGSLIRYGAGVVTYHHNLYAHHDSRNPRLGDNVGLDFVNNVLYNWGGEAGYSGPAEEGTPRLNYVGNYLVAGPSTPASKRRAFSGGGSTTNIYQANNLLDGDLDGARDGANNDWAMFTGSYTKREPARFDFAQVNTHGAALAYERVLNTAGSSRSRDAVDARVAGEVRNEGGRHINSQNEVGGYPVLNPAPAPTDSDRDGIPDEWESGHGLNASDPSDGRAASAGGYTNLERYLNDLVPLPGIDPSTDTTPPAASAALSAEPNADGWHKQDVSVTLAANDDDGGTGLHEIIYSVNGVFSHVHGTPAVINVTGEGTTTIVFHAKDEAGNASAPQTLVVKLDKTAPSVSEVSRTPANAQGWNNTDVSAAYTANDALSGFASGATLSHAVNFNAEGENQSHTVEVSDLAGNTATLQISGVSIDKTAPSVEAARVTPANAQGWDNTDVVVGYAAQDGLSGLASPANGTHTFTDEGTGQSHTFQVSDLAGNTAEASVGGVQIDKTAPAVNVAQPAAGAFYLLGQTAAADYNCSDNLSGAQLCAGPTAPDAQFDTATPGAKTFTINAADNAGNTASTTVNYTVGYSLNPLYDASKTHKSGSTIPVKLQLLDHAGANLSSPATVLRALGVAFVSANTTGVPDSPGNADPDLDFRFDDSLGGYHFNLKTTSLAPGAYNLYFTVGADPHVYAAPFQIR